jgi:hypothetical protein
MNAVSRSQCSANPRRFRPAKVLAAAGLAVLAFAACAKKGKVADVDPPDPGGGNVLSKVDSLVKANKGTGKGVVTGYLTGEGSKVSDGILRKAANAAGEMRLLTRTEIPLSGANVLLFNALEPTTAADTTVTTDSAGQYIAVLPEGQYFGFVVYLNLETFQLVTTSLNNLQSKADTSVKIDSATAVEDLSPPTVITVYDATAPNSSNVFLMGSVPDSGARINISFSEPMNRESAKGVVLGRVDTSNTASLTLKDTVSGAQVTWSGDSKQMTLRVAALQSATQYGIVIPTTLKDLAKNPLEKAYKATFVTAKASDLAKVRFAVASTFPAPGDTLKPSQNPSVSFNRPVDVFSLMKNARVSPATVGFWEVSGYRAVFVHKNPLAVGTSYTVTLPTTVTDLAGQGLERDTSFRFEVKNYDGAVASKTGTARDVALAVEQLFNAYLQGDLGRFGAGFHTNFRLNEGVRKPRRRLNAA